MARQRKLQHNRTFNTISILLVGIFAYFFWASGVFAVQEAAEGRARPAMASPQNRPAELGADAVPKALIAMDSGGGNAAYAVVVEKSTQQLRLYGYDKARNVYRLLRDTACSTGKAAGPKRVSGDSKTPEGIYFFIEEHQDSELSPIYGIKAFPTDYPNLMDRIAGLTGNAIWLHGTNKPLKPTDSNGCIVLDNADIRQVENYITLNRTPIIVAGKVEYADAEYRNRIKAEVISFLGEWQKALNGGTYHEYLRHYDARYLPPITWWPKWRDHRENGEKGENEDNPGQRMGIDMEHLSIFNHDDLYVAVFDQYAVNGKRKVFTGIRKLFLQKEGEKKGQKEGEKGENRWAIVGDDYQQVSASLRAKKDVNPLLAAVDLLRVPVKPKTTVSEAVTEAAKPDLRLAVEEEKKIERMIKEWLLAWSSQDIDAYGRFYAADFRSRGKGRDAWLRYKESLNKIYDYIEVTGENIRARSDGDGGADVSFLQEYRSSGFNGRGTKHLQLKQENGEWKIFREHM